VSGGRPAIRIGIVAGEASGDRLAAGLIQSLRARCPGLEVEGVAGPAMIAAGCRMIYSAERLAVMGIPEVVRRYAELSGMRRRLVRHFTASPPDCFIGVDAPEFNLGLEERLRARGIRTVHYVSPQVWAWRERRVRLIARAVDLMLVLFPFEERYYRDHRVPVCYVGHPLADEHKPDPALMRRELGIPAGAPVLALLPGSRGNEWRYHVRPFIETAAWLHRRRPDMAFTVAAVSPEARAVFKQALSRLALGLPVSPVSIVLGRAREVIAEADAVLTVSGTATLECLLAEKPMVVCYRMAWSSYGVARLLVRVPYFSLPNWLAGRRLVPEFLQGEVKAERLGPELLRMMDGTEDVLRLKGELAAIKRTLGSDANRVAADAVLGLIGP
jgi:lipid-A-disaccharide synthase